MAGEIPNNKSDLTAFGTYQEPSSPKTLELFWTREQSPEGTTNMDFELNQKFCSGGSNCSSNGVTPKRTSGDKLITYDLAKGGTTPIIAIRTWNGSAWGAPTVISGGSNATALGSINSSAIPSSDSGGLGSLSAFTFGEVAISYEALFGGSGGCTSLGSAYVKSRASDSFTAELKDFIAPLPVTVTNCTNLSTSLSASSVVVARPSTTRRRSGTRPPTPAGRSPTPSTATRPCSQNPRDAGTKPVSNGVVPDSNDLVFNTAGTFYWQASYSGDPNNLASVSPCTSEVLVVGLAHPQIAIVKDPKSQTIATGGTATFTITVTNTGNVTLTNVHVTDARSPGCNKTIGTMAPGATTSYTCSKADVSADFTNVAVATGTPPNGPDVTAQDSADVHVLAPGAPGIDVVKSPKSQQVASGGTATFTITVKNIGAVTLTNVHVTDQASPSCNRTIGTLTAGQSTSYSCTAPNVTSDFTNVAVATGTPPSGPDVTDSDTAKVTVALRAARRSRSSRTRSRRRSRTAGRRPSRSR